VIDELAGLDATAQAELVRKREASPAELVDAAIARAESLNPELNAIIHPLYEEGREAAGDPPTGPFRGVPFLHKDLGAGAVAGQPLHMGMSLLKDVDFRAPVDSYLTERFRAAGLVSIGRTNTPELGILPTTEPRAYGPTRNPWDPGRSPGGSSGGSAAAVAVGIVPAAHASDGGGSIRIPSSCCGIVGLKTTRQRISQGPLIGDFASGLLVDFAVARSVRDVAALLDAVHGPAPGDPYVAPPPTRPYVEELAQDPARLRVGVLTAPPADVDVAVDPAVVEAANDAARLLEEIGHAVDSDLPALPALGTEGLDQKQAFLNRYYAGQAMTLGQLRVLLGREIGPDDVEPNTWAMAEEGRRLSGGDYLASVALHQAMTRFVAGWFESGYDLVLSPTLCEPPPPLGTFDDSGGDPLRAIRRAEGMAGFAAGFNATGSPAISLPLHWTDAGLPIGVQLAAPFGREDRLIRVAAELERARPWAERRPPAFSKAA
jgi:amidase